MPNCSVSTCTNHHRKTKGSNIVYYGFPRNPHVLEAWIQFCSRQDDFKIQFGRICSTHFRQDAYKRNLKAELLGIEEKLKLKPDAIPTENKPNYYRRKSLKKEVKQSANNITQVWVMEENTNQLIFLKEDLEDIQNPLGEEHNEQSTEEVNDKKPIQEESDEKPAEVYSIKVEEDS